MGNEDIAASLPNPTYPTRTMNTVTIDNIAGDAGTDEPLLTASALDWEPRRAARRRDFRRDDFTRSLLAVCATGGCAVAAGIGALAVLHVGSTARTVALCAAPLAAGVLAFVCLAPVEARWRK